VYAYSPQQDEPLLHLQIDPRSAAPAYRQLMDQVKYYLASGTLRPGDRLPSIREAARYLAVNPSTVVKAWSELEHEGVVERKQGKGVFARELESGSTAVELEGALRQSARQLAVEATQMGAERELVLRIVNEELDGLAPDEESR